MSMCSVCGSDIKNGRCQGCGMSQSGARGNQTNYSNNKYYQNQNNSTSMGPGFTPKKKKNPILTLLIVFGLFFGVSVILGIINTLNEEVPDIFENTPEVEAENDYTYEDTFGYDEEESEEIKTYSQNEYVATLGSGAYIVGLHIPAGTYDFEMVNKEGYEWASITIIKASGERTFETVNTDDDLKNIELENGDGVSVQSSEMVDLISDNAQPLTNDGVKNPLTQVVFMEDNDAKIAGIDFPAGTYDIYILENDYGTIEIDLYDGFIGNQESYYSFYGDATTGLEPVRHIEFPTGTRIVLDDVEIELVPSEYDTLLAFFEHEDAYVEVNKLVGERLILENYQRQSQDMPIKTQGEENLK